KNTEAASQSAAELPLSRWVALNRHEQAPLSSPDELAGVWDSPPEAAAPPTPVEPPLTELAPPPVPGVPPAPVALPPTPWGWPPAPEMFPPIPPGWPPVVAALPPVSGPAPPPEPLPPVPIGVLGPVKVHQLNLKRSSPLPENTRNRSWIPLPPLTSQLVVVQDDAPDTSQLPSKVPVSLSR